MKMPGVIPGQYAYGHLSSGAGEDAPNQQESVHPMHVQAMKRAAQPYTRMSKVKGLSLSTPAVKPIKTKGY